MGRAVFKTLTWTAAAGLLLTAILPPGHDRAASDHPPRSVDARDTSLAAASSPSTPNGVVRAAPVDSPDLMHRKHQDDASGDRVDLLPNANAAVVVDGDAALVARGVPGAIPAGDGSGRNRPLRL